MRFGRLSLFAAVFVGALSIGSAEAQTPPPRSISIMGRQFLPKKLIVPQGTTVTWKNLDPVPHTVGSPSIGEPQTPPRVPAIPEADIGRRTGRLPCTAPGTATCPQHSQTFNTPGTYPFVCSIHSKMAGTIVVKEPDPTSPPPSQPPPPLPGPPGQVQRRVSILGRQFSPGILRIKQGEAVRWANGSSTAHTITSAIPPDPSQPTRPDPIRVLPLGGLVNPRPIPSPPRPLTRDDYVLTNPVVFLAPGSYPYQCMIHPGMAGRIDVAAVNPDA